MSEDLLKLRDEIDRIDSNIADLFIKRFGIVRQMGEYKKNNGIKIIDKIREKEIMNNISQNFGLDKTLHRPGAVIDIVTLFGQFR